MASSGYGNGNKELTKQQQQQCMERRGATRNDANDANHDAKDCENGQQDREYRNRRNVLQRDLDLNCKKTPWKYVYQNIRCLVSENSRIKIDYLREYAAMNEILIFNITETGLDKNIVDDAKIQGFNDYRCDRINQKQGGTVIYTKENLECKLLGKVSRGKCEMIAINIISINTINIVIYRPPKVNGEDFNHILMKLEELFINMPKPEPTIILSGDLIFLLLNGE